MSAGAGVGRGQEVEVTPTSAPTGALVRRLLVLLAQAHEEFERGRCDRAERGVCELKRALRVAVLEVLDGEPQTLRDGGRRLHRVGPSLAALRGVGLAVVRGGGGLRPERKSVR